MKVKKFVATDMRTALRNVKDELGPDAVILSNRTVNDQIEILAAMEYDENEINDALLSRQNSESQSERVAESAAAYYENAAEQRAVSNRFSQKKQNAMAREQHNDAINNAPQNNAAKVAYQFDNDSISDTQAAGLLQSMPQNNEGMSEMKSELKSLRTIIENQHTLSEWGAIAQKHPLRIPLYKRFTEMGLTQDVSKYLVKGLDDLTDLDLAMQAALKRLAEQLPIADDDIINRGGVYAMVGPTGVGKTTTIAKLAARFAMQFDAETVCNSRYNPNSIRCLVRI